MLLEMDFLKMSQADPEKKCLMVSVRILVVQTHLKMHLMSDMKLVLKKILHSADSFLIIS